MSIFDRATPEGINDTFLEEHAEQMKRYLFFKSEDYAYNDVWSIRYDGVEYVDKRNTDFWDIYRGAVMMIELDLRTSHKKGAANIKVRKHVELRHIRDLEKIFFQDIENGKYITYKKSKYYEKQNHYWLIRPFAKYISSIYPIYKYKLNYDYK